MATQMKCSNCGKVFTLSAAEAGDKVVCTACGAKLKGPPAPLPPPVIQHATATSFSQLESRLIERRRTAPNWIIAAAILIAAIVVAYALRNRNSEPLGRDEVRQVIEIKGEAERLVVQGKLAEAHAKYQLIERMVAGIHIKDTAIWDLAERAKGDQDRVYAILLAGMEAKVVPPRRPTVEPTTGLAQNNPPPYPKSFRVEIEEEPVTQPAVAATQQTIVRLAPTTRPIVSETRSRQGLPIAKPVAPSADVTDAQIGQAIQQGVEFLLSQFRADQIVLDKKPGDTYLEGVNALCVYALLQAGQAIPDRRLGIQNPEMKDIVERMKEHLMLAESAQSNAPVTYARSLRAAALAVYNRPEDRKQLQEDVQWLLKAHSDGAYTYSNYPDRFGELKKNLAPNQPFLNRLDGKMDFYIDPEARPPRVWLHNGESRVPVPNYPRRSAIPPGIGVGVSPYDNRPYPLVDRQNVGIPWDNSNSQYGLLGVWAAAEAGIEVPTNYWIQIERHWQNCQLSSGEWKYNGTQQNGYYAMTVAGVASLLVTHEYLDAPALGASVGRQPFSPWLAAGLGWLWQDDNSVNLEHGPVHYRGYSLFGIERVGLASGFKYLGKHDWYRELTAKVVETQWPNGAWGREQSGADSIIDTAYMLLFLSRGRHPVMMNKLSFDGSWNNRSRDLANLSKFAGRELERAINWQIVPLDHDWPDWTDSPILFVASHSAPKFKDEDYQKLRRFAEAGGLIFTHADASSGAFNNFAGELARKLFPNYEMATLPQDHEIYSIQYQLKNRPQLKYVSNGSRILMIHSPVDISAAWQVRDGTKRQNWEIGVNLFIYAAGKADFRNRLSSPYLADIAGRTIHTTKLAQLKYAGNWNPEPYGWERFARYLKREIGWQLDTTAIDWAELKPQTAPLAHLTGTAAYTPTEGEIVALRKYVEDGGVVLIDSCGGSPAFSQSVAALLAQAFPNVKPKPITAEHALLGKTAAGMDDLGKPLLRPYAEQKLGKSAGRIEELTVGKGRVIVSSLDLSSGLLGTNTWRILGFQPGYAQSLVKNFVIWTAVAN
jgi:hypothetical protein